MKVTKSVKEYRQLKKTGYCSKDSAEHKSKSRAYEEMKITALCVPLVKTPPPSLLLFII